MKVLVFGKTGQIARALIEAAYKRDDVSVEALARSEAEFTKPETCKQCVLRSDADVVINAAAYTAVDNAEENEDLANVVNGLAPGLIAEVCADRGIPFIHISTDYVFDGAGEKPNRVDQVTNPLSAYGRSKLNGEIAIRSVAGTHCILRTSWAFSVYGDNFVKTMLRLASEQKTLSVVADQVGGPTSASYIAESCLKIAKELLCKPEKSGTYHLSSKPDVSWADFAREIFAQASVSCSVEDITSEDYSSVARRPKNSRLDNNLTLATFGIERSDWRSDLNDVLKKLDY
ncbi:dTDP-4-dehydrorhamnose reductase [Shimia sp. R10_1]|uniref:dTDP-4-dehydrorhamnose reductase n=1 Tax=Shimia sp. R10_1 TaxID=2821095 RepID=UPI001ADD23B2|nr:dTDP-4-dehydrorhamnose reductase [Shimia sp. R10_1]MBO9473254.1 dTDP-4-dehydrorhamnose reductase [Shimia sp. R10_1]